MFSLKSTIVASALLFSASANAYVVDLDLDSTNPTNGVTLDLVAGTYSVSAFDGMYTAWNPWGTTAEPTGNCDATGVCDWGWINTYRISSAELGENVFSDDLRYATDQLALANAVDATFTISYDQDVTFFLKDKKDFYFDNTGGMSLNVSAVPEPSTYALMLGGLGLVGFMGVRRKKQA